LKKHFKKLVAIILMVVTMGTMAAGISFANTSSDYSLRQKVVGLAGISYASLNTAEFVTRQDFARMLIMASKYREVLGNTSNISVYNDVKSNSEYASAIRLCAENNLMTGYLGGLFKPTQFVTVAEAAKGLLGLLGYTKEDFAGDEYNKRMAMYASAGLGEYVGKAANENITGADCINMFYNLMCANMKNGQAYASVLGASVDSSGEVNPLTMVDNTLKGPKYIKTKTDLDDYIPFSGDKASVFVDGDATTWTDFRNGIGDGYVVYYSSTAKTVWAYGDSASTVGEKYFVKGKIESLVYKDANTMTPSAVILDSESVEYKLTTSDMQYAFSIYGSMKVGEEVVLIVIQENSSNYTVVDYTY